MIVAVDACRTGGAVVEEGVLAINGTAATAAAADLRLQLLLLGEGGAALSAVTDGLACPCPAGVTYACDIANSGRTGIAMFR